jgi:CHAT domain-containing protein
MSQSYEFLGQHHDAWLHGRRAITLLVRSGDWNRVRIVVAGLSRSELRHEQWNAARELIEAERAMSPSGPDPNLDVDTFLRLAFTELHLGDGAACRHALTRARVVALTSSDPSFRRKLLADVDAGTGATLRRQDPAGAIAPLSAAIDFQQTTERTLLLPQLYLERGRAQMATGHVGEARRDFDQGIAWLERERTHTPNADLRTGIFDDAGDLFRDAISAALDQRDIAGALRTVERGRARSMYEEMTAQDEDSPRLPTMPAFETAMRDLPDDRVVVEYEVLDDRLAIFTFDRLNLSGTTVSVPRRTVERTAHAFFSALVDRHSQEEVDAYARQLFSWLVAPIRMRLAHVRTVVLIPDDILQQVPFAALIDPATHRYLIEDHTLIDAPSAGIYMLSTKRASRLSHLRPRSVALFANPSLSGGSFADLSPLPASTDEAVRAARAYARSKIVSLAAATASRFQSVASGSDVVQFAGHTVIRPREPWHSALLFAPSGDDNGILSVSRIARMKFQSTSTVVLASCSTLRAHTAGVEGVPSISRAFLVAGVPAVIGTKWDIIDGETSALLVQLHEGLARSTPAEEALRSAQLNALHSADSGIRHPGYWAVFTMLGASSSSPRQSR